MNSMNNEIIISSTNYHYLVVRGKSFLVETETEEDEGNVDVSAGYDESNESGFIRALRPKTQNKACAMCCSTCRITK